MDIRFCDGFAYAPLCHRVHLFSRGLVCYGGTWNAPWGGYRILPFVLRSEQLEKYVRNSKGLVCMAADSVLTFACVVFGTLKYGDVVDLRDGMLATVACVTLVWAVFLIIRYLKANGFFKGALCFAASVVWVAAMTVLSNAWNGMKLSEIFSVKGADNSRYDVIVCLCLAGVAAVLGIAGVVYKFARKRSQDR